MKQSGAEAARLRKQAESFMKSPRKGSDNNEEEEEDQGMWENPFKHTNTQRKRWSIMGTWSNTSIYRLECLRLH